MGRPMTRTEGEGHSVATVVLEDNHRPGRHSIWASRSSRMVSSGCDT